MSSTHYFCTQLYVGQGIFEKSKSWFKNTATWLAYKYTKCFVSWMTYEPQYEIQRLKDKQWCKLENSK
jgi:hypothetical protein